MELQFKKTVCPCLDPVLREVRNMELTQEIRLSDAMPDAGQILCAWGQCVLRGKEWGGGSISASGGMMVWVLYAPEDGSREQCIEGWIPFQMQWDLPDGTPEGLMRIHCLTRFVDARALSARKIMVRAGVAAMAEAFAPMETQTYVPDQVPEGVELLRSRYPLRLFRETGEKSFLLDEELTLPASVPTPETVIYYHLNPKITEKRVLGNKIVFRGNGNLHLLYRSTEGQLHSWDFELPFSQFAELREEFGPDAQADMILSPTSLELELTEGGQLRFKGGIVGQFVISDGRMVEVIADAYAPGRSLDMQTETLELPTVLEVRRENLYGEQTLPGEANLAADVRFLQDFPRLRQGADNVTVTQPGIFQTLWYGQDGKLHGGTARWEGQKQFPADENSRLSVLPLPVEAAQAVPGPDRLTLTGDVPMEVTVTARQQIPMVSGLTLGDPVPKDPSRPSLILRRAGDTSLWDIAKASGSTMDAIRRLNGIQEEPAPDRMLLIPVP